MGEKEPQPANTVNGQNDRLVILHGDCVERMRTLASTSIPIVVTSCPYDQLRLYGGHPWDFEGTARELFRVMCEGGVVCWNVGDSVVDGSETLTAFKQAIFFKEQCGFRVHDTMIWQKSNFSNPETVRYHQIFEYVFVLSKASSPRVFNPIIDRQNINFGKVGRYGANTYAKRDGERGLRRTRNFIDKEFGLRYNVWRGPTAGQENICAGLDHPAAMPKWLARDLILSWSNPGDTVLDPMAGSFTTCVAALELGRKTIGIEIHEPYVRIGREACRNVTPGFEFKESVICLAKVEEPDSPLLIKTI